MDSFGGGFGGGFNDKSMGGNNQYGRPVNSMNQMGSMAPPMHNSGKMGMTPLDEPPLLEELGVDFIHMKKKTLAVLNPMMKLEPEIISDADISGPICFCLLLGFLLTFSAELKFGYIYGFFLFGCFGVYVVLNLLSEVASIEVLRVYSILGYALLPILLVALLKIFIEPKGLIAGTFGLVCIFWCTVVSTRFFEKALNSNQQRFLIAYPIFLFYACFALITIF